MNILVPLKQVILRIQVWWTRLSHDAMMRYRSDFSEDTKAKGWEMRRYPSPWLDFLSWTCRKTQGFFPCEKWNCWSNNMLVMCGKGVYDVLCLDVSLQQKCLSWGFEHLWSTFNRHGRYDCPFVSFPFCCAARHMNLVLEHGNSWLESKHDWLELVACIACMMSF